MDLTTLFGLVASLAIIITSVGFENIFDLFTDLVALKIVIGVSLSVIFINKPLKELLNIIYIVKELLFTRETNLKKVVPTFLKLSSQSRKNGILSLESSIEGIENKFLAKGLQFSIDGLEPETIRDIMNTELRYLKHRHQSGADIFTSLGNISIRIGWLGTLLMIILKLIEIDSLNHLSGIDIASTLLPLFYGMILAFLIYIPIGEKLLSCQNHEIMTRALIIEGIISISKGDNPRIIEQKLNAFIASAQKDVSFE